MDVQIKSYVSLSISFEIRYFRNCYLTPQLSLNHWFLAMCLVTILCDYIMYAIKTNGTETFKEFYKMRSLNVILIRFGVSIY